MWGLPERFSCINVVILIDSRRMNNLIRVLIVGTGVLSLGKMISGQPAFCTEDSQCSSGFYCEETLHTCHECVRCEDLKRVMPLPLMYCVKSVLDCGVCLQGYVEDLRMDRACILLSERANNDASGGSLLPPYAWALIVLCLLVVLTIISIYIFKKETLFSYICKIRTSTHASVHSRYACNGGVSSPATATAPPAHEPPPAYDPYYEPTRPVSPSEACEHNGLSEVASIPLIKRTPTTPAHGVRESSDNQAAQPFSNPSYVRGPALRFGGVEESEPASPFQPHDEDTMESFWTPNETANDNINGNVVEAESSPSTGTEAAGGVTSVARRAADSGPPAKVARVREDSNNNCGRESGSGGAGSPRSPSPTPSPGPQHLLFNVNVTNIINNLEQRNSVNMPKL